MASAQPSLLTCGEPVEFTVYDFLKVHITSLARLSNREELRSTCSTCI